MEDPGRAHYFLGRIMPGMDVCDVGGGKIGNVSQIHRHNEHPNRSVASLPEEVIEVKTGFLGLGKRLYVPMSAIQEVLTESVFLAHPREELGSLGYYAKPDYVS